MKKAFYLQIFYKIFPTVTIVAMAVFAIGFIRDSIDHIMANIEKQQASVFILVNRGQVAAQLELDFGKVGSPENSIVKAILPVDDILEFVSSLDSLGERYSLPRTATFVPPTDESGVGFDVNLKANSESLIKYLRTFEGLPYLARINSLSLVSSGKNWDEVNDINLSGWLFTRPPKY